MIESMIMDSYIDYDIYDMFSNSLLDIFQQIYKYIYTIPIFLSFYIHLLFLIYIS
jgi:hypothetical protein